MIAIVTATFVFIGFVYYVWKQSQQRRIARIAIEGIQFKTNDPNTDYRQMINNPDFNNALFIFNDNTSGYGTGGNACIRGKDRALGLPTGHIESGPNQSAGGFTSLVEAETHIPPAISAISDYVSNHPEIERVFYCCDSAGLLGVGIFSRELGVGEGPQILQYATDQLHSLGDFKGPNGPY